MTRSTRIFAAPIVSTPSRSLAALTRRLALHRSLLQIRAHARDGGEGVALSLHPDEIGAYFELDPCLNPNPDPDPGDMHSDDLSGMGGTGPQARAARFHDRRRLVLDRQLGHLRPSERPLIEAAIGRGEVRGRITRHAMHERIAALHAEAPWMAPAATAVMEAMTRATARGPAPFQVPPTILLGRPGIGKTRWAQGLARAFGVPMIDIDVGAANGATFALAGVERGFGNAAPGRLVRAIISDHVVNPLVVVDELDKIPGTVAVTRGSLPGMGEVLKGMLEPATARAWTCPFYQLPFDLSRVSWVMTANSLDRVPGALLDRCRVVTLEGPAPAELEIAAARMIAAKAPDPDLADLLATLVSETIRQRAHAHRRTSLRHLDRIIDRLISAGSAPRVM